MMTREDHPMAPENTAARDPLIHLLGTMSDGTGRYIEDMEAAGQRQLVNSTTLPTEGSDDEVFVALGFTFGEPDKDDPLFRPATLPDGWTRQGSDHSMWSYVVDEHGRKRVALFYKAAFYDRKAFMRLETVYSYASTVLYDGVSPVFDAAWCTREAFIDALDQIRQQAAERVDLYENTTLAWAAEELPKAKADLAKVDAFIAEYSGGAR